MSLDMTFEKTNPIMGPRKSLEFEYVHSVYKILKISLTSNLFGLPEEKSEIYYSKKFSLYLIENNFFSASLDYFFQFEFNNLYQNNFKELFSILLSLDDKDLNFHFFIYLNILDRIIAGCLENKFIFNSGKVVNNANLPFLLEISHKIYSSTNEYTTNLIKECNFF